MGKSPRTDSGAANDAPEADEGSSPSSSDHPQDQGGAPPEDGSSDRATSGAPGTIRFWLITALLFALGVGGGLLLSRQADPVTQTTRTSPAEPPTEEPGPDDAPPVQPRAKITGRVLGPDGEPVAGVVIASWPMDEVDGDPTSSVESGDDGRFELDGLPPRPVRLLARREGLVPQRLDHVTPSSEPLLIEMEQGAGMFGRATLEGEPVEGASVKVAGAGHWPPFVSTTRADGTFATPELPNGTYEVLARSRDEGGAWGAIAEVQHDGSTEPFDVPLSATPSFELTVVDDETGEPLPGALVIAAEDVVHVLDVSWVTGESGAVEAYGLPTRPWLFTVRARGFLEGRVTVTPGDEEAPTEVRLSRAGTIRGRVVDGNGAGVPLVTLRAYVRGERGEIWVIERDVTSSMDQLVTPRGASDVSFGAVFGFVSDEDGSFEITGLPPGQASVEARKDGFQPALSEVISVTEGLAAEDVELTMLPGYALRGRVIGPDGQVIPGARVEIRPADAGDVAQPGDVLSLGIGGVRVTDEDGRFERDDLPDEVEVIATAPGYEEASWRGDLSTQTEPIEIQLGVFGAGIRGRVVDPDDVPVTGATIRYVPNEDQAPRRGDACLVNTDEEGRFVLAGCPDEPFVVQVSAGREGVAPTFEELEPGQEVEIALRPAARATVRVTGDSGDPVGGALVRLVPVELEGVPEFALELLDDNARSDDSGQANFDGLPAGRWRVDVTRSQHVPAQSALTTAEGKEAEVTVELEAVRVVDGAVTDRYHSPAARAWVDLRVDGAPRKGGRTDGEGRFEITVDRPGPIEVRALHPQIGVSGWVTPVKERDLVVTLDRVAVKPETHEAHLARLGVRLWRDSDSIRVTEVESGSAADDAGLQRGDYVLTLNRVGTTTRFDVVRGRRRLSVEIQSD